MASPLPAIKPGLIDAAYFRSVVGIDAKVIVEIGANNGGHTGDFLKMFPSAKIYCFEPDKRAAAKFRAKINDPRVTLFELAIGAEDGETEFHVSSGLPPNSPEAQKLYPQGWDQSGSIRPPKTHTKVWPWVTFEQKTRVRVQRLDTWAKTHGIEKIDLIWADVQGAESDLILGALNTLKSTRVFYTEYSNDEWYEGQASLTQLVDMLPDFELTDRFSMDVLFKNKGCR